MAPTHIEQIQNGMIEQLKGVLGATYLIDVFPDKPAEFDLGAADRAVLVQYTGSRYAAPEKSGQQSRRPVFALHLFLRALGQQMRGVAEIEQIRFALQNVKIAGASLYFVRDGIADQTDAMWRYVIEIACDVPAVPRARADFAPFLTDFNKGDA